MSVRERDPAIKIVLYGNSGAGKSALVARYIYGSYDSNLPSTIGAAYYSKSVKIDDIRLTLNIWDTAGSERYHCLAPMYLRGTRIVLLCFEESNTEDLAKKIAKIREVNTTTEIFLIATKIDLPNDRSYSSVIKYADANQLRLFYTSSFNGTGIKDLFEEICKIGKSSPVDELDRPLRITKTKPTVKPCCGSF